MPRTNIICLGDSITLGFDQPDCDKWTGVLQRRLDERQPGRFKVYNRGIGSQTAGQGLDRMSTDVVPHLPGIVLVEFGFNDAVILEGLRVPRLTIAEFKVKLREIHRIVTDHGGRAVFLVNHTQHDVIVQGNGQSYEESYAPYETAIRDVAAELRAPSIDLPRRMAERAVNLATFLAPDGIHLTTEGNRIYGEMVFEGLQAAKLL